MQAVERDPVVGGVEQPVDPGAARAHARRERGLGEACFFERLFELPDQNPLGGDLRGLFEASFFSQKVLKA